MNHEEQNPYAVLIVDDEIFIRDGLSSVFHCNYSNWKLLGAVSSFEEAFNLLQTEHIDLLITDIQMPGKNGLELIESLRMANPNLEVIIISGYNNFEYAKRAMHNKVAHYLLKPVNLDELKSAINQIEISLTEKKQQSIYEENRQIQHTNSIINELLNGNSSAEELLFPLFPDILHSYYMLCLDFDLQGDKYSPDSQWEMRNTLKKISKNHFSQSLIFFRNRTLWGIVVSSVDAHHIPSFLKYLAEYLAKRYTAKVFVGVSDSAHAQNRFSTCFNQAYIAAKSFVINQTSPSFRVYDHTQYAGILTYDARLEDKLLNAMRTGNLQDTQTCEKELIDSIVGSNPDIFMLTKATQRLSYSIMRCLENSFSLEKTFFEYFEALQDLSDIHSPSEFKDAVSKLTDYCCRLYQERSTCRQSRIVQYIIQYIQEYYREDLSLDLLSDKVGVTPNYLSSHFKEETGMNIVEYLTHVRLEIAKDLLQNSQMKISCIAKETGYRDPKYFNRIFKKNIGVTPHEYRNISTSYL